MQLLMTPKVNLLPSEMRKWFIQCTVKKALIQGSKLNHCQSQYYLMSNDDPKACCANIYLNFTFHTFFLQMKTLSIACNMAVEHG